MTWDDALATVCQMRYRASDEDATAPDEAIVERAYYMMGMMEKAGTLPPNEVTHGTTGNVVLRWRNAGAIVFWEDCDTRAYPKEV